MEPETHPSVELGDAVRRYYAIDLETLSQLLVDEDLLENFILEIQLIRVNISPVKQSVSVKQHTLVKPQSAGVRIFIEKRSKITEPTIVFKKPYFIRPSMSGHVSWFDIDLISYFMKATLLTVCYYTGSKA
ncbi:unnamed protein product [Vicia faba]|uniref:Uncharacterized protein n=1 Tax=Vicia faba TaxID=3906 RepID=A0AAV0YU21_VICFA|nr:unnamed protein product [Vicia faba]